LTAQPSAQRTQSGSALVEQAVLGLDRCLRKRQGVYEYSSDPACLFRIQRGVAQAYLDLADGTRLRHGSPILDIHLWNEHMPPIGPEGATLGWARQVSRGLDVSLGQLACYLAKQPDLSDIAALRAHMRLGAASQSKQLARMAARYGFEAASGETRPEHGRIHRFGENILIFLLVLATNPGALRTRILWRGRTLVYLSREALERRYGGSGL
jgi:hypothetical protein